MPCAIGVGDGEEAADEGVDDGDRADDKHAPQVVALERRLEVASAGDHAGGDVEGEEEDDDDGRDDAQRACLVVGAVLEEARKRDRVVGHLGVGAHAGRDPLPVSQGAEEQTDDDPQLTHTGDEQRTRQAHQQPAGHIGGAGGNAGNESGKVAATDDVVAVLGGFAPSVITDGEHHSEVDDHGNDHPCVLGHRSPLF